MEIVNEVHAFNSKESCAKAVVALRACAHFVRLPATSYMLCVLESRVETAIHHKQ